MNNILPSIVKMHEKYDLKGSTYKRKASKSERAKNSPTLKVRNAYVSIWCNLRNFVGLMFYG